MLTKFMNMQYMCTLQKSIAVVNKNVFVTLMCKNNHLFSNHLSSYGFLHELVLQDVINIWQLCHLSTSCWKPYQSLVEPLKKKYFSDNELSNLSQMYAFLYPHYKIESLSRLYYQNRQFIMNNEMFISNCLKSSHVCIIKIDNSLWAMKWLFQLTGLRSQSWAAIAACWQGVSVIDPHGEPSMRIGIVSHFIHHEISCIQ